ncbi:MAG: hypothetical protein RJQ14_20500, partial [Marinoscillum sp.]
MKRLRLYLLVCFVAFQVTAQRSFSEDKAEFFNQTMSRIRGIDTEAARKVAFDYNNAWTGSFTSAQQDLIHKIALKMDEKGYSFRPFFWWYFSYLAYTVSQAHLSNDQVSEVLRINEQVVASMSGEEYRNFLLGLNMFMARRYLSKTKNLAITTDNGSFQFKLLEDYVEIQQEPEEEVVVEAEPEPIPVEEPIQEDSWSSDPWDSGDTWSDDPWSSGTDDSYQNNWVDTEDTWGYDVSGQMIEEEDEDERRFVSVVTQDYVTNAQSRYIHPILEGPAIELENNSMLMVSPYDSFRIKETDGTYLLKNRVYAGENAVINWPSENKNFNGAVVNLKRFYILSDHYGFWTPNATLTFPKLFQGTLEGSFEYKSVRRKNNTLSPYPKFTSNYSNTDITLNNPRIKYRGGIEISGNELAGTSVSRRPGRLTLLDGKGNKAVLRSERFDFRQDSTIYSQRATLSIIHGRDSVFHPAVEVFINSRENQLVAIRSKNYDVTPFRSTYFKVNVHAETVKWDLDTDSVEFSIMNGKDLLPVTVESVDYFSMSRFSKLGSGFKFHPVNAAVFYANKFGIREFADQELADH